MLRAGVLSTRKGGLTKLVSQQPLGPPPLVSTDKSSPITQDPLTLPFRPDTEQPRLRERGR